MYKFQLEQGEKITMRNNKEIMNKEDPLCNSVTGEPEFPFFFPFLSFSYRKMKVRTK